MGDSYGSSNLRAAVRLEGPKLKSLIRDIQGDYKDIWPVEKVKKTIKVKREKSSVSAKETKKNNCTKRNPAPPCPDGSYEKKRPDGSICCYKGTKKASVAKPAVKPQIKQVKTG